MSRFADVLRFISDILVRTFVYALPLAAETLRALIDRALGEPDVAASPIHISPSAVKTYLSVDES